MTDETNNPQTEGQTGTAGETHGAKQEVVEIREREDLGKGNRAAILADGRRVFLTNDGKDKDVKVGDYIDPRDFRTA